MCVCMCVCVCERERLREKERETERERERTCTYLSGGKAERGRQRIQSGLHADSREADAGLELFTSLTLMTAEIMIWGEVRCSTG